MYCVLQEAVSLQYFGGGGLHILKAMDSSQTLP